MNIGYIAAIMGLKIEIKQSYIFTNANIRNICIRTNIRTREQIMRFQCEKYHSSFRQHI